VKRWAHLRGIVRLPNQARGSVVDNCLPILDEDVASLEITFVLKGHPGRRRIIRRGRSGEGEGASEGQPDADAAPPLRGALGASG
jgi:hypothetical protein